MGAVAVRRICMLQNLHFKMESQLSLISYNMHGFNQGSDLLFHLTNDLLTDVILLQEHWLTPTNMYKIAKFNNQYSCVGISAMESAVNQSILRGRPYGGCCILYKKLFSSLVSYQTCSERMCALVINNVLIINVYCNKITSDIDRCNILLLLAEIQEVIAMFPALTVVWGGDFNIDLNESSPDQDIFLQFFINNALVTCNSIISSNLDFTYCHPSLEHKSFIDFFVISVPSILMDYKILDIAINLSDHYPISISIKMLKSITGTSLPAAKTSNNTEFKLRWDYADLNLYYERCRELLQPLHDRLTFITNELISLRLIIDDNYALPNNSFCDQRKLLKSKIIDLCNIKLDVSLDSISCHSLVNMFIDKVYEDLKLALITSAEQSVPLDKCCFRKFWWSQEMAILKDNNIIAHNEWLLAGKPKSGLLFDSKSRCKAAYRLGIRNNKKRSNDTIKDNLQSALQNKSQNSFWKIWRKNFGANSSQSDIAIEGITDNHKIANAFADMFTKTCQPNSASVKEIKSIEFAEMFKNYKGSALLGNIDLTNIEDLEAIICSLKKGKATGLDNISAEHILYAHPIVCSILVCFFNLMWHFAHTPAEFGHGITVPIPKSSFEKKRAKFDDFRGITLNPIISKIFEHCLLNRLLPWFKSSSNQFGFKKGHGCNHAIYVAHTTIEHFISQQSTVNICALDLTKAFDKVQHDILFIKLMVRNVPRNFIKLLHNWYSHSTIRIRWHACLSYQVSLLAGVRQGGVLSPSLFAIYIDDVLNVLNSSGLGCYINHISYNAIMYADDILLMSLSITDMQKMVDICLIELDRVDMNINIKKSVSLRIGKRHNVVASDILIGNTPISWKSEIKYLGLQFFSASRIKVNIQILRQKFFGAANGIFGKIGTKASISCYTTLINAYCIPLLIYSLEAISLSKSELSSIMAAFTSGWGKIFGSYDKNIINNCLFYCGILPIEFKLDLKKLIFLDQLAKSNHEGLTNLFFIHGKNAILTIMKKYNLLSSDSLNVWKFKIWSAFDYSRQLSH